MNKLLVLGDSPTMQTGFARVLQNLLTHWQASGQFERIDVWAIGYAGWPHDLPCRLMPAQTYGNQNWHDDHNLQRLLEHIHASDYTHIFLLQDLFHLCRIAKSFREITRKKKIRTVLYYPVDAPVDDKWCEAISMVDVPVAYTEYGYNEAKKREGMEHLKKLILPHGTDLAKYHPVPARGSRNEVENPKAIFADQTGRGIVRPDDFLVSVVCAHQKRKGLAQSLQVFQALLGHTPRRMWLYLHMPPSNDQEQSYLRNLVIQLGIEKHVLFADHAFVGNVARVGEDFMRVVYNATDLLLTTTHGEGWGLPITEAMACGTPVAGPGHTAVAELLDAGANITRKRGVVLPCCQTFITLPADNMRQRPVVLAREAAENIRFAMHEVDASPYSLASIAERALEWVRQPEFRWEAIASKWLELILA